MSGYSALLDNYMRNALWARPARSYSTRLSPSDEMAFRGWVRQNDVPFDPDQQTTDYDMRGFWQQLRRNDPRRLTAVDPNDKRMHYPDYWKTPYHETFSNESKWALPNAPSWQGDKLVTQDGRVLFDDALLER